MAFYIQTHRYHWEIYLPSGTTGSSRGKQTVCYCNPECSKHGWPSKYQSQNKNTGCLPWNHGVLTTTTSKALMSVKSLVRSKTLVLMSLKAKLRGETVRVAVVRLQDETPATNMKLNYLAAESKLGLLSPGPHQSVSIMRFFFLSSVGNIGWAFHLA